MDFSFDDLKYLVTVVSEDLIKDDFSNLENTDRDASDFRHDVSEEIYSKVHLLRSLLNELYKYRPLPF